MIKEKCCKSALAELCKEFLLHLQVMKKKGLISEAEYESHSLKKIQFLNEFEMDRPV